MPLTIRELVEHDEIDIELLNNLATFIGGKLMATRQRRVQATDLVRLAEPLEAK